MAKPLWCVSQITATLYQQIWSVKKVAVEGRAKVKETSVEWLKHYAEDKGASKEEIAKISKPKTDINIVADGVYVIK